MVDQDNTFTYSRIRNVSFNINGNTTLYPNPVSEKLFLTDTELVEIESVTISNVPGQTLLQVLKITNEGIGIHQLAAGMYLVQVRKMNGNLQTYKVVVAR